MPDERIGIWFIGAWGGVATCATVGLSALEGGFVDPVGLVTALPQFAQSDLADWNQFVVGGHDVRETTFLAEATKLNRQSGIFTPELLDSVAPRLKQFDENVRMGTLFNVGETITSLADPEVRTTAEEPPSDAISRISADLQRFRDANRLSQVIMVNVASTEPPPPAKVLDWSWEEIERSLSSADGTPLSSSTIYAIAAMQSGAAYVNFTPSAGSDLRGLKELAVDCGVLHAGRDGKTGETLLKSVLAPMFAARNLRVMSWVGHNIFGNMDGKVLADPRNKANKIRSKDHLLTEILGYKPDTLVSIEFIESLGDWKTAWDHIHFRGFLNSKMAMQFIWQGCDSLLAAPLVLDLVRLTERESRRGTMGVMSHLCSFFKSPMGTEVPEFALQFQMLEQWANETANEA